MNDDISVMWGLRLLLWDAMNILKRWQTFAGRFREKQNHDDLSNYTPTTHNYRVHTMPHPITTHWRWLWSIFFFLVLILSISAFSFFFIYLSWFWSIFFLVWIVPTIVNSFIRYIINFIGTYVLCVYFVSWNDAVQIYFSVSDCFGIYHFSSLHLYLNNVSE